MKNSKRRYAALAMIVAAAVGVAYQSILKDQIVKADYEYKDDLGKTIKILGVANISPDTVTCWDPTGKQSDELASKLTAMLRQTNGNDLSFRFGKKTRYVLVQSETGGQYLNWRSDDDYMQQVYNLGSNNTIQLYRCSKDPMAKTLSMTLTLSNSRQNVVQVPLAKDQKQAIGEASISFASATPVDSPPTNRDTNMKYYGKYWKVILTVEGALDQLFSYNNLSAIDQDGKQILYVDMNGKPVPGKTYLEDPYPENNYYDSRLANQDTKKHKYTKVTVMQGLLAQGAATVYTNVDPQFIKSLSAKWTTTKTIKFAELPLDPNP